MAILIFIFFNLHKIQSFCLVLKHFYLISNIEIKVQECNKNLKILNGKKNLLHFEMVFFFHFSIFCTSYASTPSSVENHFIETNDSLLSALSNSIRPSPIHIHSDQKRSGIFNFSNL